MALRLLLGYFLYSAIVHADYGWIPRYQQLQLRLGGSYYKTGSNFARDGVLEDISFNNTDVEVSENEFFVAAEYGFAKDWAAQFKTSYKIVNVNPVSDTATGFFPSNTGIGDTYIGVKWRLRPKYPLLTLESYAKLAAYNNQPNTNDEIVLGDGNVDLGIKIHSGYRFQYVFFALSPGILLRFGGYASAFTLSGGIGILLPPFYGLLYGDFIASFQEELLFDSATTVHDANGAAGSFSRLSGSPTGFAIGGKVGFQFLPNIFAELFLEGTTSGSAYAQYFKIGLGVLAAIDFFKPDTRKTLKEVPFQRREP